jgi:hypothetical protein
MIEIEDEYPDFFSDNSPFGFFMEDDKIESDLIVLLEDGNL